MSLDSTIEITPHPDPVISQNDVDMALVPNSLLINDAFNTFIGKPKSQLLLIYDWCAILLYICDTATNICVLIQLYYNHTNDKTLAVFCQILLILSIIPQFAYFYAAFRRLQILNEPYNMNLSGGILAMLAVIPVIPFVPLISYFLNSESCTFSNAFSAHWYNRLNNNGDRNVNLSSVAQMGRKCVSNHCGFVLQTVFESIPTMIVQIIVLIYVSLISDGSNSQDGNNSGVDYQFLNTLLSVSITIAAVSLCVRMFLIVYKTHITNLWFVFNYLCVICDILSIINVIFWIFCQNHTLCQMNQYTFEQFFQNINTKIPIYQAIWVYIFLVSTIPACAVLIFFVFAELSTSFLTTLEKIYENCCESPYNLLRQCDCLRDFVQVFLQLLFGLIITPIIVPLLMVVITPLLAICGWTVIAVIILDTNKFDWKTKYDFILWNHFMESNIKNSYGRPSINTSSGIFVINFSLLRNQKYGYSLLEDFKSANLPIRDYVYIGPDLLNAYFMQFKKYLLSTAQSEIRRVNRKTNLNSDLSRFSNHKICNYNVNSILNYDSNQCDYYVDYLSIQNKDLKFKQVCDNIIHLKGVTFSTLRNACRCVSKGNSKNGYSSESPIVNRIHRRVLCSMFVLMKNVLSRTRYIDKYPDCCYSCSDFTFMLANIFKVFVWMYFRLLSYFVILFHK